MRTTLLCVQVKVRDGETDWGWGVLLCISVAQGGGKRGIGGSSHILDVLLPCARSSVSGDCLTWPSHNTVTPL